MIAEKPSIARTISRILCKNKNQLVDKTKEMGWCHFSFSGEFKGKKANFVVSAVSGHIYQTEFLRKYQRYDIDPIELFDSPLVKKEANEDSFLNIDWLRQISKNIDILCLWLDCDREGENICYEVIYNVLPYMYIKYYQQIYRAIFSSLTKKDITNSFENIENYPDNNLSLSVDARQVIDLKVGVSLTRFLTSNILPCLSEYDIDSNFISYGPCQTPTLYFCVKRAREIENENIIYYKIYISLKIDNNLEVKLSIDQEFKSLNEVKLIKKRLEELKYLNIKNITTEKRNKPHPLGLNTVNMLKISSLYLNNSPNTTMNLAQNLYMGGYITYPRTETTAYSPSFDFKSNLKYLNNYINTDNLEDYVYENIDFINEGGIDSGDHPPITPSKIPKKGKLNKKELELYDLICDYYLASLSPDLEYENITYKFEIDNKIYKSTCSIIEKEGFYKYFQSQEKNFIDENQILDKNEYYQILEVNYEEYKKDDYLTEAELIEEMEKNHIGTDVSMSIHIENIVKRGYVEVDKENRRLIPTNLGRALIEALEKVEPDIVLPKNRAKIEEFVSELAQGKKKYKDVLDYALDFYKKKYINVSENLDLMLDVFGKYFELLEEDY